MRGHSQKEILDVISHVVGNRSENDNLVVIYNLRYARYEWLWKYVGFIRLVRIW